MRKKDKKTLVITTLICVCALTAYGIFYKFYPLPESRRENLQTFWVLATAILVNIILNIGLNFTVCKKMGAKFLVGMGKWIVPFTSIFATIIFIYSMMYPQSSLIENEIKELGLKIDKKLDNRYDILIDDEEDSQRLLNLLISKNIFVEKLEVKKPSLNDIFIEKVGDK